MNPNDIITINYQQWRVVMCNPTYALVEKVGCERVVRVVLVDKHPVQN
jgi:hypothetical protein